MEASPLTQQARPEVFQQKIVHLYEALFKVRQNSQISLLAELDWEQADIALPPRYVSLITSDYI